MTEQKDWVRYFPHTTPRDIQEKSINFILDEFKNGKRFVICEAPVGTGKSAIAITISKFFENEVVDEKNASWILTTQKILQKQYQTEFNWLPTIWSKSNYECKNHFGVSCTMGLWINNIFKDKYCDCVYTADKKKFLDSQISLTNVQFFLNHYEYRRQDISKRKLLIIDEAHNLESIITDFVSIILNKYIIADYGISWIGTNKTILQVIDWIKKILLPKLISQKVQLEFTIKSYDETQLLSSPEGRLLVKQFDSLDKYICQLNRCLQRFNPNEWVMSINKDDDEIILRPLFASRFSNKQLFETADKVLLMSGTILDRDTYCKNVGIPLKDTAFISLPSPFKKENRPVFIVKAASMSYKNIDTSLPKLASVVKKIIDDHKDEKGIIHCHSYKIANFLNNTIKTNRFLMHDSSNRIEVYNFHLNSKTPTILLSPSFTEGIDLVDELSRFQIITKVPFPYLGDNFIKEKMRRVSGWYEWETAKTIIQASGRSVRNDEDYCMTYILDEDFFWFYKQHENIFPQWYKDALIFV